MSFKITWLTHVQCVLISLALAYVYNDSMSMVFKNTFIAIINALPFINPANKPAIYFIAICYGFLILLMIPITIIHELIHGIAYNAFGGKVKYGFKIIYAYTQEISGIPLNRTKFLIILLAPATVISIACAFISGWVGGIIFTLNLLGSSGDILMAFSLIKYNYNCWFVDTSYGYDVITD